MLDQTKKHQQATNWEHKEGGRRRAGGQRGEDLRPPEQPQPALSLARCPGASVWLRRKPDPGREVSTHSSSPPGLGAPAAAFSVVLIALPEDRRDFQNRFRRWQDWWGKCAPCEGRFWGTRGNVSFTVINAFVI